MSGSLSPAERARAVEILKSFDASARVVDSAASPRLRVLARCELNRRRPDSVPSLSFLCLSQMFERQIDPFTFEGHSILMNLFLLDKRVSLVSLGATETARLSRMIEMMAGVVVEGGDADFVVARERAGVRGRGVLVKAEWIDALFGSGRYIDFGKYELGVARRVGLCNGPMVRSQQPRQQLRLTMENHSILSFMGNNGSQETVKLGLSRKHRSTRNKFGCVERNTKVDDYFRVASQVSQNHEDESAETEEIDEITLPGEEPLSQMDTTQRSPRRSRECPSLETVVSSPVRGAAVAVKPVEVRELKIMEEVRKPILKKVKTERFTLESIDSDLESEDDEMITSPNPSVADRLVHLCSSVMRHRGPSKRVPKPVEHQVTAEELETLSQTEEPDTQPVFDVKYDRECALLSPDDLGGKRDPLFDMFAKS